MLNTTKVEERKQSHIIEYRNTISQLNDKLKIKNDLLNTYKKSHEENLLLRQKINKLEIQVSQNLKPYMNTIKKLENQLIKQKTEYEKQIDIMQKRYSKTISVLHSRLRKSNKRSLIVK